MSINSVTLSGRLGKDIEIKKTNSGKSVADFSLAGYGNRKENNNYKTEWIECRAWGSTADRLAMYHRGDSITVQGNLVTDQWESNGYKRSKTYINVSSYEAPKKEVQQDARKAPQENLWTAQAPQSDQGEWGDGLIINSDSLPF